MSVFVRRRFVGASLTIVAVIAAVLLAVGAAGSIAATGYTSGWTLFGLIVFLAAYRVRKAIPFLPLGTSAAWLQLHIYCALLTMVLYLLHAGPPLPTGIFESTLALLYLTVFMSGVVGLMMSRSFPARLTMLGGEVIFEQIPIVRHQLQTQVEALVLTGNTDSQASAVAEFYRDRIRPYLLSHRDVLSHLTRGESVRWHQLSRSIDDQRRYLNADEQHVLDEIKDLIRQKHELDTKYALQAALKVWLFVHVPATWALLIFSLCHVVLVHAWTGGLR